MDIDQGSKNQRLRPDIEHANSQLTVNFEMDWSLAVSTFGLNGKGERFSSELPLHEGHRDRVYRSGGVNLLAAAESNMVWGNIHRHRIRPGDLTLRVAE